jgi:hypothetical protein
VGELLEALEKEVARAERGVRRSEKEVERSHALKNWLFAKQALWKGARDEAHRHAAFQAKRHKDFFESFIAAYWSGNRLATERGFRRTDAKARRRGDTQPGYAATWKPPEGLKAKTEVAQPDELVEALLAQAASTNADGKPKPAPKSRSASNGKEKTAPARALSPVPHDPEQPLPEASPEQPA